MKKIVSLLSLALCAVVANAADRLGELATLFGERLEIRLLQFAARMRHQPAESRQSAAARVPKWRPMLNVST